MGARSNLFRSAAREGVVIRGREFHEFDYANPAFNEIIKCIGTNFGKKKIALEIFAFPETDDYCRPPRTEESLQQPFAADEIVLPLICIIQRARERWIGFYRAWNRACSRKGDGNGLNYDPLRNLWIGGRREEANANARDSR